MAKTDAVIKALDLKNHDIAADIGAGTGYFSRVAQAVAPDGKVYAVDVAADILAYLKERADHENIHNIATIVSRPEDPMLPANSVDLAFFCDTTHHIQRRVEFYRKVFSAVKTHGRMAIIDYPPDSPHARINRNNWYRVRRSSARRNRKGSSSSRISSSFPTITS